MTDTPWKCDSNNRITLIYNNWLSSQVNVEVAKIILEEQLGVCVQLLLLPVMDGVFLINNKGNETALAILEFWKINRYEDYKAHVQNGKFISDIGELGPLGRVGWYIPHFMTHDPSALNDNNNQEFIRSYRYFRTTPKYRLITGSRTWSMVDQQIVRNLKLNLQVEYPPENNTEQYLIDTLEKAQLEKKPIVVVFWTPHQIFGSENPPQRVFLPAYSEDCRKLSNIERSLVDCDYPPTTLNKLISDAVSKLSARAQLFLRNFKYQSSDQLQIMGDIFYHQMQPREAACKWLKNNTELWMSWIRESSPSRPQQDLPLSIGMAVLAASIGISIIALATILIGCSIQRRSSTRRLENRLAPKTPPICIVFTSIQNAALLWTLATETMKKVMTIHNRVMRRNIKKFRGYEVKTHLDSFMIAFQCPLDAVACCLSIQKELLECEWTSDMLAFPDLRKVVWNDHVVYHGPRVKIGIHFGSDIQAQYDTTTRRFDYFGTTVNKASRVSKVCERGGRIYISEETMQYIKDQVIQYDSFHDTNMSTTATSTMVKHVHFTLFSSSHEDEHSVAAHGVDDHPIVTPTPSLKQLVASGQVVFELVEEVFLKGLTGKHAIYWVKEVNDPRSTFIENYEMHGRNHVAVAKIGSVATPLSCTTTTHAVSGITGEESPLKSPSLMNVSQLAKYDFQASIEQTLKNSATLSEEEKSILIQRFVLWSACCEYGSVGGRACLIRDMWIKFPDSTLMKFIANVLAQQDEGQPCHVMETTIIGESTTNSSNSSTRNDDVNFGLEIHEDDQDTAVKYSHSKDETH
ncbi:hypothetical protein C9374_013721 [Naegleria lovaniensis]|uniref:Guanylate cyclase domain-containing protein n=1 Tax=Naegleria lovaniensis TaxID=51637 RepID=A0AA88GBR7_NAELO|nr:uncharacterized protein C9374_013721 [Naegleria lovaniensis]KAG2370921.1 hypothetical protein C9374_013721 [Naegleria lovaniensis]